MTDQESSGRQSNALGVAGVLFAGTVWGTTGTAATFAPDVSAAAIGAAAMGIGGIAQALLALRGIAHARTQLWQQRGLLLLGALAVMIYPLAFYGSMRLAGVTIGTVVTIGTAPLFAALIEYVMERSLLTLRWSLGALAGVAGWAKPWATARQNPARPRPKRATLMRSIAMPQGIPLQGSCSSENPAWPSGKKRPVNRRACKK